MLRSRTNEDLMRINEEIQRLQAKRERSIDTYNTILSPACRLPPDVFARNFFIFFVQMSEIDLLKSTSYANLD